MFDIQTLFASQHPHFYARHPGLSRIAIAVGRWLWKEREFKAFAAANPDARGVELIARGFRYIDFDFDLRDSELAAIPASGPVLVIANHPLGYLDGVGLLKVLAAIRPDVKLILNTALHDMLGMQNHTIPVDNFRGSISKTALRAIREQLDGGGVMVMFPAGQVSPVRAGHIVDAEWSASFFRFALQYQAPIVPVFIGGRNSLAFYLLAAVAGPFTNRILVLRELLQVKLLREMFSRQRGRRLPMRFGKPLNAAVIDRQFAAMDDKLAFVRTRLYALAKD